MTQQKQNGKLIAIITMIFLFGMISFVTNLAAPMGIVLKNQFDVSNALGMLGNFGNFIAYAVMGIPSGILLQRVGYKKTALIAVAIGFIGVGIQFLSGHSSPEMAFAVYLIGAFVAGFSMCLLNTVVNPMLNKLGGEGNKGNQLIQLGGSFNSLAGTSVIILTGILIPSITNAKISDVFPLMYAALAIFAFAFIVIFFSTIPEKEKQEVKIDTTPSQYGPLSFRHFIFGAIGIFVYVGIEVGVPNVLNKWLQNPDLDVLGVNGAGAEAIAGSVTATYWLLMLVGRLIGASIGSKISAKAMLGTASVIGIFLVISAMFAPTDLMVNMPVFKNSAEEMFGLVNVPVNAMFLALVGLCTSIMWGGIFNLAVEGLGKYTEKASGIFMVLVCGGGILPLLQNAIVDWNDGIGYLTSYWLIVVALAYLLYYALIGCKNVNKDIKVD